MTASWNRPANAAGLEGLGDNLAFFRHGCPPHGGMASALAGCYATTGRGKHPHRHATEPPPQRACDPELLSKNC